MNARGRGWRRVGIVLSVIWFVGFAAFIWVLDMRDKSDFLGHQLHFCGLILDTDTESLQYFKDDGERQKKDSANWTKYHDCQAKAQAFFIADAERGHGATGIALLFGVDLATVLISWLVTWLVVLVVRWVGRGFASTQHTRV